MRKCLERTRILVGENRIAQVQSSISRLQHPKME